jgi:LmbE family N-acetylglucosaminyl deacetylase
MKTILVVAAHTDDEALGCGGTIARHVAEGDVVYAIFMADGVTARQNSNQIDDEKREVAAEKARRTLGIKKNFYLGLPDNRLDSIPLIEIVQLIEPIIKDLKPITVYTHHHGDLNVDHRVTHEAVMTACRPTPESSVQEIYSFEILSSTEWATPTKEPFIANHYVDISEYLSIKVQSLNKYKIEMRPPPHSRSISHIKQLALHRGNSIGVEAAEAFSTIRTIRRSSQII